MAVQEFDEGDTVRISAVFKNINGVESDPTTTIVIIRNPTGTETTYTYAVDAEVIRDAAGRFYIDQAIAAGEDGDWFYRWKGTGTIVTAEEGKFIVRESDFTNP